MGPVELAAFAFLVGLTVSGCAASLFELAADRSVAFAAPFVRRDRVLRSAAVTLLAGPFMLGNDAMAAFRAGLISRLGLSLCATAALLWTLAGGVLLLTLAVRIALLLP